MSPYLSRQELYCHDTHTYYYFIWKNWEKGRTCKCRSIEIVTASPFWFKKKLDLMDSRLMKPPFLRYINSLTKYKIDVFWGYVYSRSISFPRMSSHNYWSTVFSFYGKFLKFLCISLKCVSTENITIYQHLCNTINSLPSTTFSGWLL